MEVMRCPGARSDSPANNFRNLLLMGHAIVVGPPIRVRRALRDQGQGVEKDGIIRRRLLHSRRFLVVLRFRLMVK